MKYLCMNSTCCIVLYSRDYLCDCHLSADSSPCQVFRQEGGQRRYLTVAGCGGRWEICPTLEGDGWSLYSLSSSLCPGHPAAGQDGEGKTLGWLCEDGMEWDETVTVTCGEHWPGGEGEGR